MSATTPCIITVAITGSLPRKENNPAVPITIAEQVESTQAAFEAGATLAHLHVRNDDQTLDLRPGEVRRACRRGCERHCPGMILQFSTGGRSGAGKERGGMLAAQARHGLARHRLVQLPDPGLRELARSDRLAGRPRCWRTTSSRRSRRSTCR